MRRKKKRSPRKSKINKKDKKTRKKKRERERFGATRVVAYAGLVRVPHQIGNTPLGCPVDSMLCSPVEDDMVSPPPYNRSFCTWTIYIHL